MCMELDLDTCQHRVSISTSYNRSAVRDRNRGVQPCDRGTLHRKVLNSSSLFFPAAPSFPWGYYRGLLE